YLVAQHAHPFSHATRVGCDTKQLANPGTVSLRVGGSLFDSTSSLVFERYSRNRRRISRGMELPRGSDYICWPIISTAFPTSLCSREPTSAFDLLWISHVHGRTGADAVVSICLLVIRGGVPPNFLIVLYPGTSNIKH